MKSIRWLVALAFLLGSNVSFAQSEPDIIRILKEAEFTDFPYHKLIARCHRIFEKLNQSSGFNDNPFQVFKSDSVAFTSIPMFSIGRTAAKYDGSDLIQHLKIDKKNLYLSIVTDDKKEVIGFLPFSTGDLNKTKDFCFFVLPDDVFFDNPKYPYVGYQYIQEHYPNAGLVFGVKYIDNALWFIADGGVKVLAYPEMTVSSPDQFIASKCDENFISQLARGNRNTSCNF